MKPLMQTALVFGLALAIPQVHAFSQQKDKRPDRETKRDEAGRQPDRKNSDRQAEPRRPDRVPRNRRRPDESRRGGWVTVYMDYNRDGLIDAQETIHSFDLVKARSASRKRRENESVRRGRPERRPDEMAQIQGTLEKQAEFQLRGHEDDKVVVARLNTEDDKTARVVLGTRKDLKKLDLSQGKNVTVKGERHRINNKPVLFARTVSAQDQTVRVSPPKSRGEQRVRGTIESLEKRDFRRRKGEFLVAQVNLVNGQTRMINLGTSEHLKSLNLKEGDKVKVLARSGRINNRPALIAAVVHAKNRTVDIPRSRCKLIKRSKNRKDDDRSKRGGQDEIETSAPLR